VRSVAWTADGRYALVRAEYPPTRELGATDEVATGEFLAFVGPDPSTVTVLDKGRRLGRAALAGDRWLCAGGRGVRVVDPAGASIRLTFEPRAGVGAVATLGDVVVAGLAAGEVVRLDAADPDADAQRWARHEAVIDAIALSPDGVLVASGDEDGHLAVWQTDGSAAVLEQTVPGRVDGLCFLASNRLVVAVGGPERQLLHLELPGER
jgi:sugar lactone lactonase YvrE